MNSIELFQVWLAMNMVKSEEETPNQRLQDEVLVNINKAMLKPKTSSEKVVLYARLQSSIIDNDLETFEKVFGELATTQTHDLIGRLFEEPK